MKKRTLKIFLGMTCTLLTMLATGCGDISTKTESVMPIETETTEEDRLMDGLYESGHYVMDCEIIAVENVNGNSVCTVKGAQDYPYAFYGIGYIEGDVVKCVFWKGNDPESCIDDELVDVWN